MSAGGMHDSGARQQFSTGAQRDTADGKPMMSLVSPFAVLRLGRWCMLGAAKYSARNWEKGMPFSRVVDALERHTQAFKAGEDDEDHLAAIMWNAMALIHYGEMIDCGVLPAELNDMPDYRPRKDNPDDEQLSEQDIAAAAASLPASWGDPLELTESSCQESRRKRVRGERCLMCGFTDRHFPGCVNSKDGP